MKKWYLLVMAISITMAAGCTTPNVNITTSTAQPGTTTSSTVSANSGMTTTTVNQSQNAMTFITEEAAKNAALQHAGLTEADLDFIRIEFDRDDGRSVYDVEFFSQQKEYDYEIDAVTGDIRAFDYDMEFFTPLGGSVANVPTSTSSAPSSAATTPTATSSASAAATAPASSAPAAPAATTPTATVPAATTPSAATPSTSTASGVTLEQAKQIALNHAGLTASQATFIQGYPDYDDGRRVYDIEFYSSNREYDYEISAATGAILSFDYDAEYYAFPASRPQTTMNNAGGGVASGGATGGTATGSGMITQEQAKAAALSRAGLSAGNVSFIRVGFEYDDGRPEYQVDFVSGSTEYDVEVDARTGAIVGYDIDSVWD